MPAGRQITELAAQLQDISVVYGTGGAAVHAVRGVSLDVVRGEVLLLMGPSGSGKSTILQVLGCIRHATAGSVYINGEAVRNWTQNDLSAVRCSQMGFVFQHYNLLPSLCAWENVALALELRGASWPQIEQASRRILYLLGLSHRANAYPEELSGGEKQRVAIARAIVGEPDIVLADEPTAALDAASGMQVAQLLASIAHEHGRAVVIVTHDARISRIADRIAFLEDGKIRSTRKNIQLQSGALRENGTHEMEDHSHAGPRGGADHGVAIIR